MRRGRALVAGVGLAALFGWAACGDDDAVTPTGPGTDAGTDHATPLRDASVIIDDDAPDEDAAKPVKVHGPYDAGIEDFQTFDGGDIDGGIPCVAGGELEIEGNDTDPTANLINPPSSRCGVARVRPADPLDAGADADAGDADASAADADAGLVAETDVMTFTISKAATDIYVQYRGDGVEVLVEAGDGGAQDITKPGVVLPFKRNVPYYVRVRSRTGKNELWRVSVFEDR